MVTTILRFLVCIVMVSNLHLIWVRGDVKDLLAHLYKQASKENRPLVLLLDNSNRDELNSMLTPKIVDQYSSTEVDNRRDPLMDLYEMIQMQKKNSVFKKLESKASDERLDKDKKRPRNRVRTLKYRQKDSRLDSTTPRYRYRDNQLMSSDKLSNLQESNEFRSSGKSKPIKSYIKSPIFKQFLRFSSSLKCAARDECADDCGEKFNGKKKDKCEEKCETKFECPEPTTPDPCGEKDECAVSDECGGGESECNISTKAELIVTEKPGCNRC